MSGHCAHDQAPAPSAEHLRFRRAIGWALFINAAMFAVEVAGGLRADSVALLADAVDFFADAMTYAITLLVLPLAAVWRSRAALVKGVAMGTLGLFVLARAGWGAAMGSVPEPVTMGVIGASALAANVLVGFLLYRFRGGDANMRSVWLCTRNDVIGNAAVMLAALGVFGTGTAWPDLTVATVMAVLALSAAVSVARQAHSELAHALH